MTEKKAESKPAENNEKLPEASEQKKASDANLVHDGRSSLLGGPTQDDLNPAYAPTKVVDE